MKTSVISHRVADFLRSFPPFDAIEEPDLLELAGSGRVKFHQAGEYLFRQGDPKGQLVWVIQQGRVELLASGGELRDVLGEGALVGLDRFFGDGAYLCSARTTSDVILYGVAAAPFESIAARYAAVKRFISAYSSVAGVRGFGRTSWLDAEPPSLDFLSTRLTVIPLDASRQEAAQQLVRSRSGVAALVCDNGNPLAVLAPLDLCAENTGSARLAARPCPPTLAPPLTTRATVREMMKSRSEEIAITADGTADSPLKAILTASELALFCGYNIVRLISGILHATSAAEMIPLLQQATRTSVDALAQPLDVDDCCQMGSEIVAALANACIRLASEQVLEAGIDP
ncbi:MAG: cyclic nucleotide-binding domain-containing protein, partial [Bryobacteraceae bacterium]